MPEGPATILGGLPVWAEVSFYRGDGWTTDDDAEVDALYWLKRDGTKGAPLPQHIIDRAEAKDPYWQCDVIEKVSDHLMYEQWQEEMRAAIPHAPTCSPDYPEKVKGEPAQHVIDNGNGFVTCADCGATLDTWVKLVKSAEELLNEL